MAKYTIVHKCGHTEIVDLFGNHSDRERSIKFYEESNCLDCKAASIDLEGTPKQKIWADKIRREFAILAEDLRKRAEPNKTNLLVAEALAAIDRIQKIKDAKKWIDIRFDICDARTFLGNYHNINI